MDFFVGSKYRLDRKIGRGAYGVIYLGTNIYTGGRVAVKLELQSARSPKLATEYKIYRHLAGGVGISRVHWFGKAGKYNALVLDVLGPSLYDLFKFCGRKFTLKTVLLLADQLISRVEYMHKNNIIHRDIKPANFVMGLDMRELNQVYVIDFGLAKSYRPSNTRQHIRRRSLTGTATYASVNNHLGMEQSRRDDLESVGFTLIYFALGSLPWQGLKANSRKEFHNMILQKKINTPNEVLCKDLPIEFATYLNYCRNLDFNEEPEYHCLRQYFRKLYIRKGYSNDYLYDWTVLNNKYSSSSKKTIKEYNDESIQDAKNPDSKETKSSEKCKYQHDEPDVASTQNKNVVQVLKLANYI